MSDVNPIKDPIAPPDCKELSRLIKALKKYHKLDILNNKNDQDTFMKFIQHNKYQLLNDYNHLVNQHDHELESITKHLSQSKIFGENCNIMTCNYTSRHCVESKHGGNTSDSELNFYRGTMDSLHFYLLHLFHSGYRVGVDKQPKIILKLDEKENDDLFDLESSRIYQCIKDTMHITKLYTRIKCANKFGIKIDSPQKQTNSSKTELDGLFTFLCERSVSLKTLRKLRNYVNTEEFDSESVRFDIELNFYNSNILQRMGDYNLTQLIEKFVKSRAIFHCGYTFYYWPQYKYMEELHDNVNDFNSINHAGYSPSELFVEARYRSLGEEMRQYKHFLMCNMSDLSVKVKDCMLTDVVKGTRAKYPKPRAWRGLRLRYGIQKSTRISENHVRSLVLYTDYTELCTEFSSSFRAMTNYESMKEIKARNSYYFWMSKYLRETVQIFGDCQKWKKDENGTGGLAGPFYCGLSCKFIFCEFDLRLSSPTSTSINKETAIKFNGGGNGIVLELNNTVTCHQYLRGFSCSSLSKYKEENEVLFFGGHYQIRIESVIYYGTNPASNYKEYFSVFNKFGQMFDGWGCGNGEEMSIISNLIKWKLEGTNIQYNKYACDTFEEFTQSKKHVVFCLNTLQGSGAVKNKILPKVHRRNIAKQIKITPPTMDSTISTNLFDGQVLFGLFDNLQKIEILTTSVGGAEVYSFSFCHLIELISAPNATSLKQVIIKATKFSKQKDTWLCQEWSKFSNQLSERCEQKGFKIVHQGYRGRTRSYHEACITIEKLPSDFAGNPILPDGKYRFVVSHSFKSLNVQEGSKKQSVAIIQMDTHDGKHQIFSIKRQSSGYYSVQCDISGLYWDICKASTNSGAKLQQYRFHGGDNQLFEFIYFVDDKWQIKAKHSGKYLSIAGAKTKNGANVIQWHRHNNPDQLYYSRMQT